MVWMLGIVILLLSSCGPKPQERHYTEIRVEPVQPGLSERIPLSWAVPAGWQEAAGGDMRLASFHPIDDPKSIDCSITALTGPAGGLDANLGRWLGQLGLQVSADHLHRLLASAQVLAIKDGHEARVFDFTGLQTQGQAPSMIAAVITLEKSTVFVKMTGPVNAVKENKDHFLTLLASMAFL